jgi:hypothetical protein
MKIKELVEPGDEIWGSGAALSPPKNALSLLG